MESVLPIAITPASHTLRFPPTTSGSGFFAHVADHFLPHHRNNYHPHIFSHRATALLSALLITVKIFTIASLTFGPVDPAFSSAITISNIISLTNASRQEFGLSAVSENIVLNKAAQAKADDMLAKGYFAHNSPDGRSPWDFISSAGYNYITAGENLAVNFTEAENVEAAWMNSPGHKANIINKAFEEIGVGIAQGDYQGHQAIFVVQMFGTKAAQKIALNEAPTPVQTQSVPEPAVSPVAAAAPEKTQAAVSKPVAVSAPAPVPVQQPAAAPLAIEDKQVEVSGEVVTISAKVSSSAVKVIATLGRQGLMLEPRAGNFWQTRSTLSEIASLGGTLVIKAFDLAGNSQSIPVAEFAGSTPANYQNSQPQVAAAKVNLFGSLSFSPKTFEYQFFMVFAAAMLASLILAIAVHRHVQHVRVIANGSFVVILAMLLLM